MVVHTRSERARVAQQAVVEFLLINHPLDCPVCDKGGECPLQDITFGWGGGQVALHRAQAPLPQAARALAADRDRPRALHPLLPLRALLAGDLRGLPADPARARRRTRFVGTFDGHPYVAPFSGNIVELCPVGALTSRPYRFRARPWDIEGAGAICTLCPAQCNVTLTVRDERVLRVLDAPAPRGRRRLAVRQGPLRLPGHARRRAHHRADDPRRRRAARGRLGARAEPRRPAGCAAPERHGALAGGGATTRRACCSARLLRDALGSRASRLAPSGAVARRRTGAR